MKQDSRNAILWLIASCGIHIVLFRSKLDMGMPIALRLLFVILAVVITLPLHELIHCVFMRIFGLRNARIEFGRDPLGIPSLRSTANGEVRGWRRIVILLSPFVLLTLVPDLLFIMNERIHFLLFIAAMCNSAGCYFDAADAVRHKQ